MQWVFFEAFLPFTLQIICVDRAIQLESSGGKIMLLCLFIILSYNMKLVTLKYGKMKFLEDDTVVLDEVRVISFPDAVTVVCSFYSPLS